MVDIIVTITSGSLGARRQLLDMGQPSLWRLSFLSNLLKAWPLTGVGVGQSSGPEQALSVGPVHLSRIGGDTVRLQTS